MPGRASKIPEALEEELLHRAGKLHPETRHRWTHRQLAAWLEAEHQVSVSHQVVGLTLGRLREDRRKRQAEVLRGVLVGEVRGVLREIKATRKLLAGKLNARVGIKALVDAVDAQRKVLATIAEIGGVKGPTQLEVSGPDGAPIQIEDARHALSAALEKLAGGADPGAAEEPAGDPPA